MWRIQILYLSKSTDNKQWNTPVLKKKYYQQSTGYLKLENEKYAVCGNICVSFMCISCILPLWVYHLIILQQKVSFHLLRKLFLLFLLDSIFHLIQIWLKHFTLPLTTIFFFSRISKFGDRRFAYLQYLDTHARTHARVTQWYYQCKRGHYARSVLQGIN